MQQGMCLSSVLAQAVSHLTLGNILHCIKHTTMIILKLMNFNKEAARAVCTNNKAHWTHPAIFMALLTSRSFAAKSVS